MQLIPLLLLTAVTITGFYLISETEYKNWGRALIVLCSLIVVALIVYACYLWVAYTSSSVWFYAIMVTALGFLFVLCIAGNLWELRCKKRLYLLLFAGIGLCGMIILASYGYKSYIKHIPVVTEQQGIWKEYLPYGKNTRVAALDEPSQLVFSSDLPVMDGATAMYPVYSAFARAVYPKAAIEDINNEYLSCNTSGIAYERLITGDADIIFAPVPSDEQLKLAESMQVELVCTPVLKEAFVFFVNKANPIDNLSIGQLQGIYSGRITDWEDLGAPDLDEIKAFQRNKGSISQRALEMFMDGKPTMKPPTEDVLSNVGVIVSRASDYKNFKNSIGFSFKFYCTEMVKNNEVKLLAMEGIEPSFENINNESYPATAYVYAVTRSNMSENTKKLLEWITGRQGQALVKATGYAPVK